MEHPPTNLYKLTVFLQLIDQLHVDFLSAQKRIIEAAGVEDLRYLLLNRCPLRSDEMPKTVSALIRKVNELLPDIKRIIENKKY